MPCAIAVPVFLLMPRSTNGDRRSNLLRRARVLLRESSDCTSAEPVRLEFAYKLRERILYDTLRILFANACARRRRDRATEGHEFGSATSVLLVVGQTLSYTRSSQNNEARREHNVSSNERFQ